MGIQAHSLKEIISLKDKIFGEILLISKLRLYLHPKEIITINSLLPSNLNDLFENYQFGDFAEFYLSKILDNINITTIDYSNYEGANLIHDLNVPISSDFYNKYSLIVEGGTLEHLFNFPVAIKNMMLILKRNGFLIINTPSNNQSGHGFYQFSSELFYRVFSIENGFEIKKIYFLKSSYPSVELSINKILVMPLDVLEDGIRAQYLSCLPIMLFILVEKINLNELFTKPILQSDYVLNWNQRNSYSLMLKISKIIKFIPHNLKMHLKGLHENYIYNLRNKKKFTKLND